jgi:hypothetical protein
MALADSGRAIGAVTLLLQDHLIRRGFDVAIGKPEEATASNTTAKLNLFLYETAFDASLRNQPLQEGRPPPLWLVLKYLLTAFDDDENSDTASAHELLGRGMAALHELNYLRLDPLVDASVRKALEHNPEPLKLTFDESTVDLLSKIMQGAEERYRLSVAFQMRPIMIVPGTLPTSSLLVGVDYTTSPSTVIGRDGVQLTAIPSLGTRLLSAEPTAFEAGAALLLTGDDLHGSTLEVLLGDVPLQIVERNPAQLRLVAEGSPGTPIASGGTLSAGELPLVARRQLSGGRVRSSNLLAVQLLPRLGTLNWVVNDLVLGGQLLGTSTDDVLVLLQRVSDGSTAWLFDTFTHTANQQTLTLAGAKTVAPAGSYRVVLYVNGQQARNSPAVTVP